MRRARSPAARGVNVNTLVARSGLIVAVLLAGAAVAVLLLGGPASTKAQAASSADAVGTLVIDGNTLPVLSFSAGVSNPATIGGGSGGGSGKASFSSFNVMTPVSAMSPVILAAVASGKHFPTAVFTGTLGAGSATATLKYELENVIVESSQHSGSAGGASESLSIVFGKVKWTYTDSAGTVTRGWDIVNNVAIP
jgi:type VI secretion system secreted protein Hcp